MGITRQHRFTKQHRCPICDGCDQDPRGAGKRCMGFMGSDGKYAHCSREDLAGPLDQEENGTYAHKLSGPCKCGVTHREDFTRSSAPSRSSSRKIAACYAYTDASGKLLYEVVRFIPKGFGQRHLNGGGTWVWNRGDSPRVLYRLQELIEDDGDRPVYIVEGEKDADALANRAYVATCNPEGAGKWHYVAALAREVLKGRDVVVISDRDGEEKKWAGERHALQVASSLEGIARSVTLRMAAAPHKDVSDLLAAGESLDRLVAFEGPPADEELAPSSPDNSVAGFAASFSDPEAEAPPAAPPIVVLRWADISKPLPPLTYLVKEIGMVDGAGPPHIVAGYGYTGKTIALQSLALSLVSGRPIWGAYSCKDTRRVVHVDIEQGDRIDRRRYQRLAFAMGIGEVEIGDRLELVVLPKIRLLPRDRAAWFTLMQDRDLIIIDSLRAATPGLEENSSAIRDPLDMLLGLSEETRCRVIIVHHAGKPQKDEGGGKSKARYSLRGSSAIFDASDGVWILAGEKGEPVNVSCERVKTHGEACEDFALVIQDVPDGEDPKAGLKVQVHGPELVKQKREEAEKVQRQARARFDADTLRTVLSRQPGLGKRELRSAMRMAGIGSVGRIDDALAFLGTEVEYREEARGRTRTTSHFLRPKGAS